MSDENYAIKVAFEGINEAIADFEKLQNAVANIKAPVINIGGDEATKIAEASLKKLQLEIDALEAKKAQSAANDVSRADKLAAKQAAQADKLAAKQAAQDAKAQANAQKEIERQEKLDAKREASAQKEAQRQEQSAQKLLAQLEKQEALSNRKLTQGNGDGNSEEQKKLIRDAKIYEELIRYKQQLAQIKTSAFSADDSAKAEKFAASINQLNLAKIDKEFAQIGTGTRNFTGNMRDAAEQLSVFASKVNELRQISIDYAVEFNAAGRQLSTRSDNSTELIAGLKGLNGELKSQVSTLDLVKNAYANLPANFLKTADAVKVSAAAAKLAQGTSSDLGGTTKGLSQLLVAYGADASQAASFADKLAFANKQTGEKTNELASDLARLVPASKAAGLGFDELNALLIQATNQGIPARQALGAIETSLKQITTDEARQEFERLGIAFDENILKQKGYVGLLKEVNGSNNLAADSITKIFGEQAKLNKIIPAGIDGFKKLDETVQGSAKSQGLASVQFDKTAYSMTALKVSVEEAFTALGQAVLKVANPVLQGTKALADAFIALPTPIQNMIGALVGGAGVFLSVSAALTGILAVVTPTIGAFKILATTFATLGSSSLVSIFDGIGTSLRNADGSATKFAENLKTVRTAVGLLAAAYIAIEVGRNIFDQLTEQARKTENATKDLTKSYEEYLRVLKKTPDTNPNEKPKTLRQEVDEKRSFTDKALDFTKDVVTFGLPIGRSRLDNDVDSTIIAFSDKIAASDKAIKEIEQLQARLAKGEKVDQKQIQATTQIIQDNINSFKNFDALGVDQKAARNAQLTALDALLDRQNKLTAAKVEETAAIQKASAATKQQLEQAKQITEQRNQDTEKNLKRTIDDAKLKRDIANKKIIDDLEEKSAQKKGELDRKQAIETESLKAKQQNDLQDKQKAFDDAQNAKKLAREQAIDDKKIANENKLNALKQAFDDRQNAIKEARTEKQRKDDEAFALARSERDRKAADAISERDRKNSEASTGAKLAIENEGKIATADPKEKAKIAAQIAEENRIRNEAKSQGQGGVLSQDQLIAQAKQLARVQAITTAEEQTKVSLALAELEKANSAKQAEIDKATKAEQDAADKAEDIARAEEKRAADKAFELQQQTEKRAFDEAQNVEKLRFEREVLTPEKLKLEQELQAQKLNFERTELAALKTQQAQQERDLKLKQELEGAALKKASDAEIDAAKAKQKADELILDRKFEDEKIERERSFKEQQRALDKASAIEIQQILGKSAQQIIDALATVQGGTAFGSALGAGTGSKVAKGDGNEVPAFASGVTNFVGGAALVGERGAELVTLPRGANVIPANQTRNVLNSGGNKTYTFNITNAGDPMAAAYQVQREIARSDALASGI